MISGIICEFNPLHDGHKYLIDTVREKSDGVVCVMSGSFVQRGEFAVYDKFKRAESALNNGADLVIELPCIYSLMSANGFAKYAVQILEATGIIDEIAFGTECDNMDELKATADKIRSLENEIKDKMKEGLSYPSARKAVVKSDILDTPNNILALEYINATKLPCRAVKRIGKGHDTDDVDYSASAIRKNLSLDEICSIKNCEVAVLAKLRTMCAEDFAKIEDVTEGLENRIVDSVRTSVSLEEIYNKIKTKRYTHSRIRRIILRAYLGITEEYSTDAPYIRILGFNNTGKEFLSRMKKNTVLPIVSRYADIDKLTDNGKKLFELECRCTDLYNLGYKSPLPCGTEQRTKIIIK
ncbi:MAG: nucleotidyltransferase family protein [Eubacterium sp.]|nr:nucleotidyltransferase family protein [Eubacterium sp.]MDE6155666.1 nucleotidyltransferase family protein [Eubacterium sp.]